MVEVVYRIGRCFCCCCFVLFCFYVFVRCFEVYFGKQTKRLRCLNVLDFIYVNCIVLAHRNA
jgi:hypothetical protein